jgi:alpha-galactosidase
METIANKMIAQGGHPAAVTATTDRREALDGADYVIISILVGGREPIVDEIDIPLKHGVDQCIGDTMGPGGIFRGARTLPVMIDIAHDVKELCPEALILNYTNPMSLLCHGMREAADVRLVGLCHSVQGAHSELARLLEMDPAECASWTAGINHQAWVLSFTRDGRDLYPELRQQAWENEGWYEHNTTRVEMFRRLGYYVTESSGHNSEYNPWFRKRPDLIEEMQGEDWNGGTGFIKKIYSGDRIDPAALRGKAEQREGYELGRGHEYGSYIINALETGERFRFNATVANTGLITNLPGGCSVEVPCYADRSGVHPCHVGELPPQLAALNAMATRSLMMALDAILAGDEQMLYWSLCYDPLTAAALSLGEIRDLVDEMLEVERDRMPTFSH